MKRPATPTPRPGLIRMWLSDAAACVAIFAFIPAAMWIAHGFGWQ